jgi:pyruvate/2-oxoglutarate dehydrogenase complex dihydrolipoamide dehydrogenase (E3) component
VLGGQRAPDTILTSLKDALPGVEFIRGVAVAAHESEVHVELRDGSIKKLAYDHLIISVGCSYAQPIKAALKSSDRRAQLAGAQRELRGASSVLVVGGGAVGVEVAGELAANHTVTLTAREDELVRDLPEAARRYALEALRSKNVRVELSSDGERGSFDARVACYGARPRTGWLATFLKLDARGFVRVDGRYRTSMKNVWAAGDCVAKDADQYLAAYAHFEGEYVASMVASEIFGSAPPGAYIPPARIVALALGPDDGVLCYGRVVVLRGRAVPWVKALVERWVVRLWPLPYELFRRLPALA